MRAIIVMCLACSVCLAQEPEQRDGSDLDIGDGDAAVAPPNPALEVRFAARKQFRESKEGLEEVYRKGLAKAVGLADEVRLYLLDFEPVHERTKGERSDYFPIRPYGMYSRILEQKTLVAPDAAICSKLVSELLSSPEEPSPFCHFPIHGIRLYRAGELIFESSLCWSCSNYFVEYPDDFETASWVGFSNQKLESFLKKQLPIPQTEIDRFKRQHQPTESKERLQTPSGTDGPRRKTSSGER